jgi:hypothetical protein
LKKGKLIERLGRKAMGLKLFKRVMIAKLPNRYYPHLVILMWRLYMGENNQELKNSIRKFNCLLEGQPDDSNSVFEFISFLRYFLRIKAKDPIPTIEVMTLIKEYKPTVFNTLKQMSKKNDRLLFLTELSMGVNIAEERLNKIIN